MVSKLRFRIGRWLAVGALLALSAPAMSQVLFTDSFESGNLSATQNGVKWGTNANVTVSRDIARTGSNSLRFFFKAGSDGWSEQRFSLGKDYRTVQVQWWAYYPDGTEGLGARYLRTVQSNNKFIRLWKGDKSDGADGYGQQWVKAGASSYNSLLRPGDESVGAEMGTNTLSTGRYSLASKDTVIDDTVRGKWTQFRFVATASSAAGRNDGVIELYRNNELMFRSSDVALYGSNGTAAFDFGYLLGHANAGFARDTYVYFDDIQISASAAVVPNAPTSLSVQ